MATGDDHNAETGHAGHDHGAGASTNGLAIALGLTTLFLIAELVGAFMFDSLALLSDAAHSRAHWQLWTQLTPFFSHDGRLGTFRGDYKYDVCRSAN